MHLLRVRTATTALLGLALLAGASAEPAQAAVQPALGATPGSSFSTTVQAAARGDSRVVASLRLPALPRKSQKVVVRLKSRKSGRASYITRLTIKRSGEVRLRYLRASKTGKISTLGKSRTILKRVVPGVSYTVETKTIDRPTRVDLSTRIWKSSQKASTRQFTRQDRSRYRLRSAGSVATTVWSSAGGPKPVVALVSSTGSTSTSTNPSVAAPTPAPSTPAPATPAPSTPAPSTPARSTPAPTPSPTPARVVGDSGTATFVASLALPPSDLGGVLPSSRQLAPGQRVYVSPSGSDTASGSLASPVRTVPRALQLVGPGGQVVLRGGTYPVSTNAGSVYRDKSGVTITNFPGERPVLDGTVALTGASRAEESGVVSYAYQQVPAGFGEGVDLNWLPAATFSGSNPTGLAASLGWECVAADGRGHAQANPTTSNPDGCPATSTARVIAGFYPDQVWVKGARLTQVLSRSKVRPGYFYVPRSAVSDSQRLATRLYLDATDEAKGSVRVSATATRSFFQVDAPDVTINGLEFRGFSSSWNNYPIHLFRTGHRVTLRDVLIVDSSGVSVKAAGWKTPGGSDILRDVTLDRVRIVRPAWKGLSVLYVTGLNLESVQIDASNASGEWTLSSAMHVTHTHNTTMRNSVIKGSGGIGAWFDQSSYNTRLIANRFEANGSHQVFYEFSHALTMVGNLLVGGWTDATLRLSGASDTALVNNTIVGGRDSIWAYVDSRAKKYYDTVHKQERWCSEHRVRYAEPGNAAADCNVTFTTDFDTARLGAYSSPNMTPGLNWRVSITSMVNNVIGPATAAGHCLVTVPVCITGHTDFENKLNEIPMNEILPSGATLDGNVYQTPGQLLQLWGGPDRPGFTQPKDIAAVQSVLSGSYYRMTRPEWHAVAGAGWTNGSGVPTSTLEAKHAWAAPSPNNARVTAWLPAGSRHYGAFWG